METGHEASLMSGGAITVTFILLLFAVHAVRVGRPDDFIVSVLWTPVGITRLIVGYFIVMVVTGMVAYGMGASDTNF